MVCESLSRGSSGWLVDWGVLVGVALVTGAGGLIGSEAVRHFAGLGLDVVGIDNDMRAQFFGREASTAWNVRRIGRELGSAYLHFDLDIRDRDGLGSVFKKFGSDISVVIHTAAQPSHDWAVRDPFTDFDVNAVGTLNVLQNVREHCEEAPFIHCSTNKVYGDGPNRLPFEELETRFELVREHPWFGGIPEEMSIDQVLHSVFGASKVAADVMVQEYGRYFGMRTAVFRGGTLTGPAHSATELHGYLAYLMRCNMEQRVYKIFGYKGKMVRDSIHSHDVLTAFEAFFRALDAAPSTTSVAAGGRTALIWRRSRWPRRSPDFRCGRIICRITGSAIIAGGSGRTRLSNATIRRGVRSTTYR